MKHVRKALALMLAMFVSLVIAAPAFAAPTVETKTVGGGTGSITVTNAESGSKYSLIKVFDATLGTPAQTTNPYKPMAYKITDAQKAKLDSTDTTNFDQDLFDYFDTYWELGPDSNYVVWKGATDADKTANMNAFKASIDGLTGNQAFVEFAQGFGDTVVAEFTNSKDQILFDELPFGYYVVTTDTKGNESICTIDSTTPDVEVIDKNPITDLHKTIESQTTNGTTISTDKHTNSAALDEEISFKVTSAAKNWQDGKKRTTYWVTDQMDPGFSLVGDPVVKVGSKTLVKDTDYTITSGGDGSNGFVIEIPWTTDQTKNGDFLYGANDGIEITYTAKLDSAKVTSVNYDGPNHNIAYITPEEDVVTPEHKPPTPGSNDPHEETNTYMTGVELTKTDDAGKALAGAVFTLTKQDGSAFSCGVIEASSQTTQQFPLAGWTSGTKWYLKAGSQNTATSTMADFVDEDPTTTIQGLDWTDPTTWAHVPADPQNVSAQDILDAHADPDNYLYTLTDYAEYTAGMDPADIPAYQEAASQTTSSIVAKSTGAQGTSLTATTGADGKVTFAALAPGKYKIEETTVPDGYVKAADLLFEVTFDNQTKKFSITQTAPTNATFAGSGEAETLFTETVIDPVGTEFPETGGMGTRILYTVGGLMVAGAAIYLITKKRMASEA